MIHETLETKITENCDVLVCGGGIAGISAALAAARHGSRVILLERGFLLGGLATVGLITYYLPLCDGCGRQVSFGIAEELLRLSISMGAETNYPALWLDTPDAVKTGSDPRYETQYNQNLFALLCEKLLVENGVDILYGTMAVGVSMESDRIDAVIIENKSGRQAIRASAVIDATGDCDIAHFAGAPTATFSQGNILASWYYSFGKHGYTLRPLGAADIPDEHKNESNRVELLHSGRFIGLDARETSRITRLSHEVALKNIIAKREEDDTFVPTSLATVPQVRMTRRIRGEYTLHDSEMHKYFADSIGMIGDWRRRGPAYEIPFAVLHSAKVKNLLTAGRSISVSDSMWDISRVIPACAITGQAAGTAAAMCPDVSKIDVSALQSALYTDGVKLHESEL